ncbi:hypothetical protein B9G98_01051 [Wickerhamiella sorbophila]|uniref:Uncharacterized protein n=1 Tax=Wickerhamiella sorbophila TaxID=45607 RepID=A0A2T0FEL8_9ASCO|nr:hypothetical protein B9G98_01051 [Wickerhamiella sorbophila]PRT53431.1 hypothetical protein B9G98_01051 [Wickerhamiella sorbophila]
MYAVPLPWLLVVGAAAGIGYAVYNNWDELSDPSFWGEKMQPLKSKLDHATNSKVHSSEIIDTELDAIGTSGTESDTEVEKDFKSSGKRNHSVLATGCSFDNVRTSQRELPDVMMPSSADSKVNISLLSSETEGLEFTSEFSMVSDLEWSDFSAGDADTEC